MSHAIQILRPDSRDEVIQCLHDLNAKRASYAVEGFGSRREQAAPEGMIEARISLSALREILELDAADMSCRVQCGLHLGELQASLRERDLALEPGPFLSADSRSLGGLFSEAPHCSRGFDRAALRSQLLGLRGLDAGGREFQAGGRVVKNVAGYDIMKLFVGGGGAWFVGLELDLRLIRRPELCRIFASPALPIPEALALWRALRPAWVEARSLDLHLLGDGSAIVELMLAGSRKVVEAWARPEPLTETRSGPELWDEPSPHAPSDFPTWRGQIRPSESPAFLTALPDNCRGSLHMHGDYTLIIGDTLIPGGTLIGDEQRQEQLQDSLILGRGMSPQALDLACRLKRGLAKQLAPGRLSFDTAMPGEGLS